MTCLCNVVSSLPHLLACLPIHPQQVGWLDGKGASIPKVKGSNLMSDVVCDNGMLIKYFPIEFLE